MITKPTVLVLGAGASKPYDFPVGQDLLDAVIRNLISIDSVNQMREFGFDFKAIQIFSTELHLSQQPSVDAFLEHRPEFSEIGKLSMAMQLIECEYGSYLFDPIRRGKGFYRYLFTQLNTNWNEFSENQLSIITFNYDRSLEHYFFTALKHSYNKSDDLVADALSNIPIIHVHGILAPLPWQETGGIPYAYSPTPIDRKKLLEIARHKMLIVSEEEKSTTEFNRAFDCLKSAERIYFLGFGYHRQNLRKLRLDELPIIDRRNSGRIGDPNIHRIDYRGSAYKLGKSQMDMIQKRGIWVPSSDDNDLQFLRNYAILD